MKSTSWLVPTTGINANVEQRMYKAMIQYPYKYNAAMLFSNVIIAIINIINRFLKSRKA